MAQVDTPVTIQRWIDENGYPTEYFYQYQLALWRRTGGPNDLVERAESAAGGAIASAGQAQLAAKRSGISASFAESAAGGALTMLGQIQKLANVTRVRRGTWTPEITFQTPGNLSVTYGTQAGTYIKIGSFVQLNWVILTTSFTHTTASGQFRVTGVPFKVDDSSGSGHDVYAGAGAWQGITKANYTQLSPRAIFDTIGETSFINFLMSGSGQNLAHLTNSDMPTGGTVALQQTVSYFTDE